MPYIETQISNFGFPLADVSPADVSPAHSYNGFSRSDEILDEIDDHLHRDRFATTRSTSDEAIYSPQPPNSESEMSLIDVDIADDIATDSEAISVQSHHSSMSDFEPRTSDFPTDDIFQSTGTVREQEDGKHP